jgi:ribosomal protein S27AE
LGVPVAGQRSDPPSLSASKSKVWQMRAEYLKSEPQEQCDEPGEAGCMSCGNTSLATLSAIRLGDDIPPIRYRMYCGKCGAMWQRVTM